MRKIFTIVLLVLFTTRSTIFINADTTMPNVASKSAILMDKNSGRVLWGKDENEKMPMASTTKIMTLLVALEKGDFEKEVIVSSKASRAPDVQLNIKEGEKFKLEDLLYPLMLESSNDVAIAIGEHTGGSVEGFAEMMTEKAKEIGAVNTQFKNPNGLDEDGHYSTAYDLALITKYALDNPDFVKIINTKTYTFKSDLRSYTVNNKNRLLSSFNGGNGVKTGYTNKAANCFVGSAKRDDVELISVVLQAGWGATGREGKWTDTYEILNYGFDNFHLHKVIQKGEVALGDINVLTSKVNKLPIGYTVTEDFYLLLSDEEKENIYIKEEFIEEIEAPVNEGMVIGEAKVYLNDDVVNRYEIKTMGSAKIHDFISCLEAVFTSWFSLGFNDVQVDFRSKISDF